MQKEHSKGNLLKGAFIIAFGGFLAKLIGGLYRIPLTNFIGAEGIGLYQLVYPVYCILLTVSGAGIPSSIAKLTAERIAKGESERPLIKKAFKLFIFIGFISTLFMCILAPTLAKWQSSEKVLLGYYTLAPSVLLVSALSVFRGVFQGKNDMLPTALSEIVEQVVKVAFGLLFAYIFRSTPEKAVVYLLLAVTISEAFALFLMWAIYRRSGGAKEKKERGRVKTKHILKLSIPVTLSSILLPFSSLIDSILVVRILNGYAQNGVKLYGLFSGGAVTLINLPVSICYGIAAASIPAVASALTKSKLPDTLPEETGEDLRKTKRKKPIKKSVKKSVAFSLFITLLISIPSSFAVYFFAEPIIKIVFRNLSLDELSILTNLTKLLSVSATTLSCAQTLSACLTAQGKPKYGVISMLLAMLTKTGLYLFFMQSAKNGIYGLAYATNIGYMIAFLLNLLYNFCTRTKA